MKNPADTQVGCIDECRLKQKGAYHPHSNSVIKKFYILLMPKLLKRVKKIFDHRRDVV